MTLAHDLAGDGPAAVLLHDDRRMWDPQWSLLIDAGYRVLRCDFRGHGDTPAATEPFNPAADVRDLLDGLGLDTVILIGASYGGRVAQEIAARWPKRVSALLLICAATRLHPPTEAIRAFSDREEALLDAGDVAGAVALNLDTFLGPAAGPEARAELAAMQRRSLDRPRAAHPRDSELIRNDDYDLSAVTARTLVVSGAHDVDYFRSTADFLAASIPGAAHERLAWAGHLPSNEDPAAFNRLLLGWLGA